jgi:hypothetical protein
MINHNNVFTSSEVARILRISAVTLWRERKAGRIGFHRIASKIVFTQQDLDDYLATRRVPSESENKNS